MMLSGADCTVYKMHGDLCSPEKCILTKDDYERYGDTHEPFINILKRTLIEKTVLFIGYSFNDQDLRAILSTVRKYYNNNFSTHYWVTKRVIDSQSRVKQELFEQNLLNYGIQTIEIDDFAEISNLLKNLYLQSRMNSVFISGASAEAEKENENNKRHLFIKQLSAKLIKYDMKIVNGYGLGVGSDVVEGAYAEIYRDNAFKDSSNYIKLYPFYQSQITTKDTDREEFKENYRNEMLRQVGFAIFIYGTKLVDGKIVDSTGLQDEFRIANENDVIIIPVGSTGGISKKIWNEVFNKPKDYGYDTDELKGLLKILNDVEPNEMDNKDLLSAIFKIIEIKRGEVNGK